MHIIKVSGTIHKRGNNFRRVEVEPFEMEVACPASMSEEHRLVGLRHRILHTAFAKKDTNFQNVKGVSIESDVPQKDMKPSWAGKVPADLSAEEIQEVAAHYDLRGVPLYRRATLSLMQQRIREELGDGKISYSLSAKEVLAYHKRLVKARRKCADLGIRSIGGMSLARLEGEIKRRKHEEDYGDSFGNYEGDD